MNRLSILSRWVMAAIFVVTLTFISSETMASDLPVNYRVLLNKTKKQGNGTQLTFNLHADAACATTPVFTDTVFIEDVTLLEELRFVKRLGASPVTRTAHMQHVLTGVTPTPFLFLHVIGAFPPAGDDCQQQILPATNTSFPPGTIALWSGALTNLPAGWALCDGSNGTPDLQDRFVQGVSTGQDPGVTGGTSQHSHTAPHTHPFSATAGAHDEAAVVAGIGVDIANANHTHSVSGTTATASPTSNVVLHPPRFYELAYIMKLP